MIPEGAAESLRVMIRAMIEPGCGGMGGRRLLLVLLLQLQHLLLRPLVRAVPQHAARDGAAHRLEALAQAVTDALRHA